MVRPTSLSADDAAISRPGEESVGEDARRDLQGLQPGVHALGRLLAFRGRKIDRDRSEYKGLNVAVMLRI